MPSVRASERRARNEALVAARTFQPATHVCQRCRLVSRRALGNCPQIASTLLQEIAAEWTARECAASLRRRLRPANIEKLIEQSPLRQLSASPLPSI